jgi:hypothetical protein
MKFTSFTALKVFYGALDVSLGMIDGRVRSLSKEQSSSIASASYLYPHVFISNGHHHSTKIYQKESRYET